MRHSVVVLLVLGAFFVSWLLLSYEGHAPEAAPASMPIWAPAQTATLTRAAYLPLIQRQVYEGPCLTPTPTPTTTAIPHPVAGSVRVEVAGWCCYNSNRTINIDVYFEATSPFAEVTEMRVATGEVGRSSGCLWEEDLDRQGWVTWEPFVSHKTYQYGPDVTDPEVMWSAVVQYQDAAGNLSPVYCDWVYLEKGTPTVYPTPTITPMPTITPACPPPGSCGCFDFGDPVCGVDGRTYSNECYALCFACVAIAYRGPCLTPTPTGTPTWTPAPVSTDARIVYLRPVAR